MSQPHDVRFFDQILQHLQQSRGFDFTAYKRTSLMRRLVRRMQTINVPSFEEYLDCLQVDEREFEALFNTLLINVTSFFRDPEVWAYLKSEAIPRLLADRPADAPFRVWSAGCASGQEAYSVVMILTELMGEDAVRERVKIYATDIDEEALKEARTAVYTEKQLEGLPAGYLETYVDRSNNGYAVKRNLRRAVIFGRHDLLQDAPISRVDLLLCRNTLMYLNAEAQTRVLARFFFSMNPGANIVMGRAEMLFSHAAMFAPIDLKRRVFRAVPRPSQVDRMLLMAQAGREASPHNLDAKNRFREIVFESERDAQIVVDASGTLVAANAAARQRLGLSVRDIGRPLRETEIWYRPADLDGPIHRATTSREVVTLEDVRSGAAGAVRVYDVVVSPLFDDDQVVLGTRIAYEDVTELSALKAQLQHSRQELETAYEELQSTNEELETTNEELQSTVEELETTNEELQSTNEELEAMNEELQSTNEELQTMNDELRNRGADLNAAHAFLESVFASLRSGVIVVDRHLRVQVWNERSTDLWGVRPDEARGSHLLDLDIGLPPAELHQPIRDVLGGETNLREVMVDATNRRGKPIRCRLTIAPLLQSDHSITGAIMLMEESAATAVQG